MKSEKSQNKWHLTVHSLADDSEELRPKTCEPPSVENRINEQIEMINKSRINLYKIIEK